MSAGQENTPAESSNRLEHWAEWRARCALGLCSSRTQETLRSFAGRQFGRYARRYAHRTNVPDRPRLSESEAWHVFETHLAIRQSRQGKSYKQWIFARVADAPDPLGVIRSGAAILMREVTREHLRREYSPATFLSLSMPIPGSREAPLTLEDLLPGGIDPADETARREFERLAAGLAREFYGTMNYREKIAVLARALGLAHEHPAVERSAACRRTSLRAAYQEACRRLQFRIRDKYRWEEDSSLRILMVMTFRAVTELVREWAKSHRRCARLCSLAEVP